jgi:membrane-associated phospholipid phosphatase
MMESVWQWGLSIIVWMQTMRSPIVDAIFWIGSFLGEEESFFLLFATLIWAIDMRIGFRIGVIFLISVYLNSLAKVLIAHPRPYDLDPSVGIGVKPGLGYGIPSGHAQNAVVIWGGLAAWRRTTAAWIGAILIAGLIGISRIYRGVHFPTDVLGGWLLGAIILFVGLSYARKIAAAIERWSLAGQLTLAVGGPVVLAALFPDSGAVTAAGTLAGAGCGMAMALRRLPLDSGGALWQRALRLLLGLFILLVLYVGLKMIFPGEGSSLYQAFRFLRYVLLGLWVTLGAPWLFDVLRLTRRSERRPITAPTRA